MFRRWTTGTSLYSFNRQSRSVRSRKLVPVNCVSQIQTRSLAAEWLMLNLFAIFFSFFLFSIPAQASITITPKDAADLQSILIDLANQKHMQVWCAEDCAQIQSMRFSGMIASGKISFRIRGNVAGKKYAAISLFGTSPAVRILSLKNDDVELPIINYERTFYTFLAPGQFDIQGTFSLDPTVPINVTYPESVGKIILEIEDQEPLLAKVPRGQEEGSFQIVPRQRKNDVENNKEQVLRLTVLRSYTIAPDKTFSYSVSYAGAKPGQVIHFPISKNEKVLNVVPATSSFTQDHVAVTAAEAAGSFSVVGQWLSENIELKAVDGAVDETWEVLCAGGFDCTFEGEVDKVVGVSTHRWSPLPGQELKISWKELELLPAQSLVAQEVLLASEKTGRGLKQRLSMLVYSSASDQFYLDLPEKATVTELRYNNGGPSAILKNDSGQVHLTIPQGSQRIDLSWEFSEYHNLSLPMPKINLPIGHMTMTYKSNENAVTLLTWGSERGPVILFWTRLVFVLIFSFFLLRVEKNILSRNLNSPLLIVFLLCGFALVNFLPLFIFVTGLCMSRFFEMARVRPTVFGRLFFFSLLTVSLLGAMGSFLHLLHSAFIDTTPIEIDNMCSYGGQLYAYSGKGQLCWSTTLPLPGVMPQAPRLIDVGLMTLRSSYFVWALFAGFVIFRELKCLVGSVRKYLTLEMRPFFSKEVNQRKQVVRDEVKEEVEKTVS